MYALPKDFDPAVFVGIDLLRVCFPPYGLELHFGKSVWIAVFGPLSLNGEDLREEDSLRQGLVRLVDLCGSRVSEAGTEGRGTIVLVFEAGETLKVIEDGDAYECYTLHLGEREIIV